MDFEKLCAKRYSLRKFSDAPVEKEKLEKIIEAGHNAPTAHNNQPQRIFVLQSKEALEKADACTPMHFHAPVMLVVAYDAEIAWKREFDGKKSRRDRRSDRGDADDAAGGGSGPGNDVYRHV